MQKSVKFLEHSVEILVLSLFYLPKMVDTICKGIHFECPLSEFL